MPETPADPASSRRAMLKRAALGLATAALPEPGRAAAFPAAAAPHAPQPHSDLSLLRRYGFVGDGKPHPLSSVTTLGGQDASGWTLAQWQAVFPFARSLADEIDGLAIQAVVNAAPYGVAIRFPACVARLSRPIQSGGDCEVTLRGAGMTWQPGAPVDAYPMAAIQGTALWVVGPDQDVWDHGAGTVATKGFYAYDIAFWCSGGGRSNAALRVRQKPTSPFNPSLVLERVLVIGASDLNVDYFHTGIHLQGCAAPNLKNVYCQGQSFLFRNTNAGIWFDNTDPQTLPIMNITCRDCTMNGWNIGYRIDTNRGGPEGNVFDTCLAACRNHTVFTNTAGNNYLPPQWTYRNCNWQGDGAGYSFFGGLSDITITDNDDYMNPPGKDLPAGTVSRFYSFNNCAGVNLLRTKMTSLPAPAGVTYRPADFVFFDAACRMVRCRNTYVQVSNGPAGAGAGITFSGGAPTNAMMEFDTGINPGLNGPASFLGVNDIGGNQVSQWEMIQVQKQGGKPAPTAAGTATHQVLYAVIDESGVISVSGMSHVLADAGGHARIPWPTRQNGKPVFTRADAVPVVCPYGNAAIVPAVTGTDAAGFAIHAGRPHAAGTILWTARGM